MMRKVLVQFTIAFVLSFVPGALALECYMAVSGRSGAVPTDQKGSWVELDDVAISFSKAADLSGRDGGRFSGGQCTLNLGSDQLMIDLLSALAKGEQRDVKIQVVRPSVETDKKGMVLCELELKGSFVSDLSLRVDRGADGVGASLVLVYSEARWVTTYFPNPSEPSSILAIESGFDFISNQLLSTGSTQVPTDMSYEGSNGGGGNTSTDRDNDGMPNDWETTYSFNPDQASDASGDPDQDGFTNLEEYLTGTHPRQATSYFRMTKDLHATNGQVVLSWNSVPGKKYTILATDDLSQAFQPLTSVTAPAGSETSYTVTIADGAFFKVTL